MRPFGFSTGALALGNFDQALKMLDAIPVEAIELSALRIRELPRLLAFSTQANLSRFSYVSVHAPTDYTSDQEHGVIDQLAYFAERGWPIVAHPDVIHDYSSWRQFGGLLLIENMDKRKLVGRTVEELRLVFEELPNARMCFDIAHARQVDTSMTEAYRIVKAFCDLIGQLHISVVNTNSKHDLISPNAAHAFRSIAVHIPGSVPAILETPVKGDQLREQLKVAASSLEAPLAKLTG